MRTIIFRWIWHKSIIVWKSSWSFAQKKKIIYVLYQRHFKCLILKKYSLHHNKVQMYSFNFFSSFSRRYSNIAKLLLVFYNFFPPFASKLCTINLTLFLLEINRVFKRDCNFKTNFKIQIQERKRERERSFCLLYYAKRILKNTTYDVVDWHFWHSKW